MENMKAFLKRKNIEISLKRYGIDALGAMAQGLFCSLLIGTILNTLGTQLHIPFLSATVATINGTAYTVGGLASAMSGPAMAVAIGYALQSPPAQEVRWQFMSLPLLQQSLVKQFQRRQRSISLSRRWLQLGRVFLWRPE